MTRSAACAFLLLIFLFAGCHPVAREPGPLMASLLAAYPESKPFPNSSFVELAGARLHYLSWSPPEEEPPRGRVLLVHGFAASVFCWRFLGPALAAEGYAVLAVDWPPFGWSTPSLSELSGEEAGTPERRATLLWAFLDAMDRADAGMARSPWILMGHSLGGRITSWMASQRPGMTEALVLLAPAVSDEMGPPGMGGSRPVQGWLDGNLRALIRDEALVRSALARVYGSKPSDEALAGYWAPFFREEAPTALSVWARKGVEKALPDFAAIGVRTLILWGEKDRIVRPAGKETVLAIPGSRLVVIAGGSHCIMETRFPETWEAIAGFLREVAPGTGEGGARAGLPDPEARPGVS